MGCTESSQATEDVSTPSFTIRDCSSSFSSRTGKQYIETFPLPITTVQKADSANELSFMSSVGELEDSELEYHDIKDGDKPHKESTIMDNFYAMVLLYEESLKSENKKDLHTESTIKTDLSSLDLFLHGGVYSQGLSDEEWSFIIDSLTTPFVEWLERIDDTDALLNEDVRGRALIDWIIGCTDKKMMRHLLPIVMNRLEQLAKFNTNMIEKEIPSILLYAANAGRLSLVVPFLQHLLFIDHTPIKTYTITTYVFPLDWNALNLSRTRVVFKLDKDNVWSPLAALFVMSKWSKNADDRLGAVDMEDVQQYVQQAPTYVKESNAGMEMYCATLFNFLSCSEPYKPYSSCSSVTPESNNLLEQRARKWKLFNIECGIALLQIRCKIDFTVSNMTEVISYAVSTGLDSEYSIKVLKALVDHVFLYRDQFDWGAVFAHRINDRTTDFISSVAEAGRLSIVWPWIKHTCYFSLNKRKKMVISFSPVISWDWLQLDERTRRHFNLQQGIKPMKTALLECFEFSSTHYLQLSLSSRTSSLSNILIAIKNTCSELDMDNVWLFATQCILDHCDIVEQGKLLPLVLEMELKPINFIECYFSCGSNLSVRIGKSNKAGFREESLLSIILYITLELIKMDLEELPKRLICSLLKRIADHPEDTVKWWVKLYEKHGEEEDNVFTFFASHQLLSFFVDCLNGISDDIKTMFASSEMEIHTPVSRMDWESLSISQAACLTLTNGFLKEEEEILTLSRILKSSSHHSANRIKNHFLFLLSRHTNINYFENGECALINFFLSGSVQRVASRSSNLVEEILFHCLGTCDEIDFTLADKKGDTALHLLCKWENNESACQLLKAIIKRVNLNNISFFSDKINWYQRNSNNHDFVQLALLRGRLSSFLPIIENEPFFQSYSISSLLSFM